MKLLIIAFFLFCGLYVYYQIAFSKIVKEGFEEEEEKENITDADHALKFEIFNAFRDAKGELPSYKEFKKVLNALKENDSYTLDNLKKELKLGNNLNKYQKKRNQSDLENLDDDEDDNKDDIFEKYKSIMGHSPSFYEYKKISNKLKDESEDYTMKDFEAELKLQKKTDDEKKINDVYLEVLGREPTMYEYIDATKYNVSAKQLKNILLNFKNTSTDTDTDTNTSTYTNTSTDTYTNTSTDTNTNTSTDTDTTSTDTLSSAETIKDRLFESAKNIFSETAIGSLVQNIPVDFTTTKIQMESLAKPKPKPLSSSHNKKDEEDDYYNTNDVIDTIEESSKRQFCSDNRYWKNDTLAKARDSRNMEDLELQCKRGSRFLNADDNMVLNKEFEWSVPQKRAPICTPLTGACDVQMSNEQTALIGTLLNQADNTQVGSILPKFTYREET